MMDFEYAVRTTHDRWICAWQPGATLKEIQQRCERDDSLWNRPNFRGERPRFRPLTIKRRDKYVPGRFIVWSE